MKNFWNLYQEVQQYDKNLNFVKASLDRLLVLSAWLPPTVYGHKYNLHLTGDLDKDLYNLGGIDTAYLDDLYSDMNKTGLYKGNNEILRTLYNIFMAIKKEAQNGVPRTAAHIEKSLGHVEALAETAAEALQELDQYGLATFYAGVSGLAMALKDYAVANFAVKS